MFDRRCAEMREVHDVHSGIQESFCVRPNCLLEAVPVPERASARQVASRTRPPTTYDFGAVDASERVRIVVSYTTAAQERPIDRLLGAALLGI